MGPKVRIASCGYFPPHQQFFGFSWSFAGTVRYICFSVLPFVLSSACYCFTELLRPLVKRWRSMSHNCFVYVDDSISGARDYVSASAASMIQSDDFNFVRFRDKWRKIKLAARSSRGVPGILDKHHKAYVSDSCKESWKTEWFARALVGDGYSTYRALARLAGFIRSLSLAVGPIARLFTRQMHCVIHSRPYWDATVVFEEPLMQELKLWFENIHAFAEFRLRPTFCADSVLYTDASDFAYGGYIATLDGIPFSGMFPVSYLCTNSNFQELKAVL